MRRHVDAGRELDGVALDAYVDRPTGRGDLSGALVETLEPGRGASAACSSAARSIPSSRSPASAGSPACSIASSADLVSDPQATSRACPRLQHDHADRMRDDVVQFARDPRPVCCASLVRVDEHALPLAVKANQATGDDRPKNTPKNATSANQTGWPGSIAASGSPPPR